MESNKSQVRKSSCNSTPNSRRQSLTAQLTRTARRFSAALAPHLIKLDPLPMLQNHEMLNIRLANVKQVNYSSLYSEFFFFGIIKMYF